MKKNIIITSIILILLSSSLQITTASETIKDKNKEKTENIYYPIYNVNTLPDSFSWTDINGVDFTTPVRSQSPFHSCETFAFTAAVETMVQKEVGYPFGCDLSEAHLYFWSGGNLDWGSYPENDTNYLVEYGIPDEACWPYPKELKLWPKNTTSPDWMNRTVKVTNWSYLPAGDINAIKYALVNNGPVPVYFQVYEDFKYYEKGVYRHIWGKAFAIHLVCVMGFVDDPKIFSGGYWIVKNSWGKRWGENGWFKIAYGECSIEELPVYFGGVYGHFPIVYVDIKNTDGPWDGSKEHPYQTIQEGMDSAHEGWTVYVKNGTYNGDIIINKSINLDGENRQTTILSGSGAGNVIYIKKPGVRISGFTIQNSGSNILDAGISTLSLNSEATIQNNIIKYCDVGILLNYAYEDSFSTVKDNIIQNNREGMYLLWSNNFLIENNTIMSNSEDGINFEASMYGTVKDNNIFDNTGCGLRFHGSSRENIIKNNLIEENNIGIKLDHSNKNKINENTFNENGVQATFKESYLTNWNKNTWSDWRGIFPRPIRGTITNYDFKWINFDFRPKINLI